MAAAPNSPDLTALLSRAIESYDERWRTVDDELYALCRRRNNPRDFPDVYTKVAIIGRGYRAGVARSWRASGDAETEIAKVLITTEVAEFIQDGHHRIGSRPFDRSSAAEIVQLHGHIVRAVSQRSGNVFLTSFVSKYLHFHFPIAPIYDSNAQTAINQLVDRRAVAGIRSELRKRPESVRAYSDFVAAFIVLYERAQLATQFNPTVKQIDHLLWQPIRS